MSENTMIIRNLNNKHFYIPAYQRGYKWEKSQAEALLEDIEEFQKDLKGGTNKKYLLQPLVVKHIGNDEYNVVDGQQRLTTILLILSCLRSEVDDTITYTITYETRKDSNVFLEKELEDMKKEKDSNSDFFHIYNVKKTIDDWLDGKSKEDKNVFNKTLLDQVCFIWYPIGEETEASVFRRINEGKIAHTQAELIKGLLLNSYNYSAYNMDDSSINEINHRIAMEWDAIETELQNDEFWLFIRKEYDSQEEKKMPARIEYLFSLVSALNGSSIEYPYAYFEKRVKEKRTELEEKKNKTTDGERKVKDSEWVIDIWNEVKAIYQILNEWYYNPATYHYVGYLITVGNDYKTIELIRLWKEKNKEAFITELVSKISVHLMEKYNYLVSKDKKTKEGKILLTEYSFDDELKKTKKKQEVRDLLLLHNIETVLRRNEYLQNNKKYNLPNFAKFEFHLYKREQYEIEHIRPNSDNKFDSIIDAELYLRYALISGLDLKPDEENQIKDFIHKIHEKEMSKEALLDEFTNNIQSIVSSKAGSGVSEEDKNKFWNFTLLDKSTNAGYGNYIFPIKRAYLIEKEKGYKIKPSQASRDIIDGDIAKMECTAEYKEAIPFVPPCTRYVFTKYYNMRPTSFIDWTEEDARSYLGNMEQLLEKFGVMQTVRTGGDISE